MPFLSKLLSLAARLRRTAPGKEQPFCSAVVVAAGTSRRMGGKDKLFLEICGAPVLAHTLLAFQNSDHISEIIIVARCDMTGLVSELCERYGISKVKKIVTGGESRQESVLCGVNAASKKASLISIHDGARPCVDGEIIGNAVSVAAKHHAAAAGIPLSSTVKKVKLGIVTETVDREGLYEIQTPQVFASEIIKAALKNAANKAVCITDDCMAVELLGIPIHITEGSRSNIKLTTGEDILIAEGILYSRAKIFAEL